MVFFRDKQMQRRFENIPLSTRLYVSNQHFLIDALTKLGYREDKSWDDSENELLRKICEISTIQTERQIKNIKKWIKNPRKRWDYKKKKNNETKKPRSTTKRNR